MALTHIKDLTPDPVNRRKHNPRNVGMLVDALQKVGASRSIVIDEAGTILAGNGVVEAASEAGLTKLQVVEADGETVIAVRRVGLSPEQKRALAIYDNRTAELAEWNVEQLAADLTNGEDLTAFFFADELKTLLAGAGGVTPGLTDPDDVPQKRPTGIVAGDLFELGRHRLLCGDSTARGDVARLFGNLRAVMVHADPPYGMGKEADGIANDNLYREKLDAFQMQWWMAWRDWLADNGSLYIWGNPPDLWRLWYLGGLDREELTVRNEIVWDKGSVFGMRSAGAHSFPPATERCLFLMRGQQFLGNQNIGDYWEGYEPLRAWLEAERDRAGMTNRDVNSLTNTQMAGHWFSKSQFAPISKMHYETLRAAAAGRAFTERYDDLFARMFPAIREGGNEYRRSLSESLRESRSFFDNTHDTMTDVWQFPRAVGDERFGHATPKPVAMVIRALKSSSETNDVIGVPFSGTGPEFIAGEQTGRACAGMELDPGYCQVIIDRWEAFTGQKAQKVGEAILV